jgi:type IV fimbrial biogenesis protein FimT
MPASRQPVGLGKPARLFGVPQECGFTLIELMVTVAVLAVLIAAATPNIISVINSNRLTTHANELVASLQQARMEALRRNASVTVCRTTNGAACDAGAGNWTGWLTVAAANGEVLRSSTAKAPVQISSPASSITFRADGLAWDAAGLVANDITVCIPTANPATNKRVVSIGTGSRISTVTAGNGNGVCP